MPIIIGENKDDGLVWPAEIYNDPVAFDFYETHFEETSWSYNLRIKGAILLVNVPATKIKSEWRGDALNKIPNLSISYLLTAACIISTAQQAKPNVNGHKEPALIHEIVVETFVVKKSKIINTTHRHNIKPLPTALILYILKNPVCKLPL